MNKNPVKTSKWEIVLEICGDNPIYCGQHDGYPLYADNWSSKGIVLYTGVERQ